MLGRYRNALASLGGAVEHLRVVIVRRIEEGEGELLRSLRLAALSDAPSAFGSGYEAEAVRTSEEWEKRAAALATSTTRSTWFAVDEGGEVLGLIGGYRPEPESGTVELVSMWTAPQARRLGLARQLVDVVVGWAREVGATRVSLWVTRGSEPAQRLYESMGFVETGDFQPLPSDPCKDELRMTRSV
jgi:ribosomal protein S18 acetylase RimI-like enzyme